MNKILIISGPNLNLLGTREPEIYGSTTLADIENMCGEYAAKNAQKIDFRQSNHEGVLVDWIQEGMSDFDGLVINAAAYTHTSVSIYDALKMLSIPIIEVHISDPDTREEFRHHSFVSPLAKSVIKGHGAKGYVEALELLHELI